MRIKEERSRITVDAPAKLNLFLEVIGKRADGYHLLETVMVPVTLFDTLSFTPSEKKEVLLVSNDKEIPIDERNTVVKAVKRFCEYYGIENMALKITLKKRIPQGAGLGGGSSDAVASLFALYRWFKVPFKKEEAIEIARGIGADCPFFVHCRPALLTGIGDEVKRFLKLPERLRFLVFVPNVTSSTALVYKNIHLTKEKKCAKLLVDCIDKADLEGIRREVFNRLEEASLTAYPELQSVATEIRKIADFVMTGSGSGWFFVCERESTQQLREQLRRMGGRVLVVRPYEVKNRGGGGRRNESDRGPHQVESDCG
ncbi:MAG: 4-(cytidine 5'-diphospho)-2-C-methyl-D-erythritol kinase [Planctomycetota bacterium]|nr:4-(cytidine 5'-diphospho)-2-C-methyl-D-erythritol kinase [Planctomycetota bacterium]